MKDYLGQKLNINDLVLIPDGYTNDFMYGECRVLSFKPQKNGDFVEIERKFYTNKNIYSHSDKFKRLRTKILNIQYNVDKLNNG